MRLLEVLQCNSSSRWSHIQSSSGRKSHFSLWGTEKNHQPLERPEALRRFQLESSGENKGMHFWHLRSPAELAIPILYRASCSSCEKWGVQMSVPSPSALDPPWVLPGMGRILASKVDQAWGHFATLGSP